MAALDKHLQQVLMGRLEQMGPEKLQVFDSQIGPEAAQVLLYDLLPELDFLLLQNVKSLQGHQYQPERVLGGQAMAEMQQAPQQMPSPAPRQMGGLGGLGGNS